MAERGVAIVTGAGRGLGLAIAEHLLASGFAVAFASIEDPTPAAATRAAKSGHARYYPFDVAQIDRFEDFLGRVEADLGGVTCLVNNAGVTSLIRGDMLAVTPESFDRSVAVNLRGTFFLSQAVAKRMLQAADGDRYRSIVTISSVNASIIGEDRADYCITKSALSMMSGLFAARLAEYGIGVFELRPGIIETDMTAPVFHKYDPYIKSGGVPMQRWGKPQDVAQAVTTLATGGLPFATGLAVDIGGGLHLHRLKG